MRSRNYKPWVELALMLVVSAILYLPFITQFGYYNDDWYSMYAARVGGTQTFHEMYGIDRPGRAYVMIPLYELFQGNPLYYSISAYVFRLLGAICMLWLLRIVWPRQRVETFIISFLFLVYPGFLSMPNAIDFQSHLIGILLAFVSIALSLLAVSRQSRVPTIALWVGAVLTGWAYLSQMEYYIGFEAVRVLLIGVIVHRKEPAWKRTVSKTALAWLPYSAIPIFYLIWRIFLFDNERATTDAGIQLGGLASAPLATLYTWIGSFIQSFLNVLMFAWGIPLSQLAFPLDVSSSIKGITIALVVVVISLLSLHYLGNDNSPGYQVNGDWRREMLTTGLLWTAAGLIVVTLANRTVSFPVYSRYGLVSATGAIMVLVAGITYISEKRIQVALLSFLLFSATFTHYANGLQYARLTQSFRAFWWQVAWRVPQLNQGSTIIANYPNSGIREDSFVWGPANHIYYPYKVDPDSILAGVYAILLDHDAVTKILTRERQIFRKHIIVDTYRNYRNFVILTQPSPGSCVQVIDGTQPEYSRYEIDPILVIGPYSEIEHVVLDDDFKTPPQFLFGPEPTRTWCYYYEKAAYERQRGDWEKVLEIGEQAFSKGLAPRDLIEWMPFLQAYAKAGDSTHISELAPLITEDPFVAKQVCESLRNIQSLSPDVQKVIDDDYCSIN